MRVGGVARVSGGSAEQILSTRPREKQRGYKSLRDNPSLSGKYINEFLHVNLQSVIAAPRRQRLERLSCKSVSVSAHVREEIGGCISIRHTRLIAVRLKQEQCTMTRPIAQPCRENGAEHARSFPVDNIKLEETPDWWKPPGRTMTLCRVARSCYFLI